MDAAAQTRVSFARGTARGICPSCGKRFTAIGPGAPEVLQEALTQHDDECADLQAATALLPKPADDLAQLRQAWAALRALRKRAS